MQIKVKPAELFDGTAIELGKMKIKTDPNSDQDRSVKDYVKSIKI